MGSKSSNAPPPDPRLVEAQMRSMGIQDSAIQSIMAQSAEMAPLQREQMRFGLDTSRQAWDQSQADRGYSLERRGQLTGLQDQQIADAKSFNTADRANELAGQASADVNAGFANAAAQNGRAMARMGVNPSSGRAAAMGNQTAIAQAAALAGAATNARTGARMEGRALTDRASNSLAGYPNMGMQTTGSGAGFGANGINIANTGLAGLNSGAMSAGGMAGQMGANAANMYGTMGNYQNQANANAAANNPFASILGAGAQLGAAAIFKSDRRLKENIVHTGLHVPTGLKLYEFNYIADPAHRFRGVMADEVEKVMPEAVIRNADGFMSVDYAMLGIDMVEVGGKS